MRPRLPLLAVLSLSLLALALAGGCSRQSEGERCDQAANGNADCEDGLVCVPFLKLQGGADKADRCCATPSSDSRCTPGTPRGLGTAGTGGSTSDAGDAGGQAGAP